MKEAVKVYDKAGLRGTLSLSTMDEKGLPESIATTTEELSLIHIWQLHMMRQLYLKIRRKKQQQALIRHRQADVREPVCVR